MPWRSLLAAVLLTIALAILFRVTSADIDLQTLAYSPVAPHWPHAGKQPWKLLHDVGTIPGLLLTAAAIAALAGSFVDARFLRWRYPAAYILLLTAIGPGLFTNIFGKILAGRPRPDDVMPFGGTEPFLAPFVAGTPGRGFSFLCGHCSMGFLFVAFFFLCSGWKRWAALACAAGFGLLLGAGRIAQAAHFPSDVLLGGSIMFALSAALAPIAARQPGHVRVRSPRLVFGAASTAIAGLVVVFLLSTPLHREKTDTWLDDTTRRAATYETIHRWRDPTPPDAITIEVERGDIEVRLTDDREPLVIRSLVTGYGWPGADGKRTVVRRGGTVIYKHRMELGAWETHAIFEVRVRRRDAPRVSARTRDGVVRRPEP
jgi:membrane-associated PAP2 superfamily phosphatase